MFFKKYGKMTHKFKTVLMMRVACYFRVTFVTLELLKSYIYDFDDERVCAFVLIKSQQRSKFKSVNTK